MGSVQMPINSRAKGSAFERKVAAQLEALTGIKFSRDLEQYRNADRGDLIPDDPSYPFLTECKFYASGSGCKDAWKLQATKAAEKAGKIPCVIWKYNRQDIHVSVPLAAIGRALGADWRDEAGWAEITLEGLAYLAGELMAVKV